MTSPVLAPCPFCNAAMSVESNRDWHRIVGDHDDQCVITDRDILMVPATDEQLALAVRDWSRRAPAQPAQITSHACIDWNEISRRGLLVRINQEIMHPLGLAVARDVETGQSPGALVSPDGAWTYAAEEKGAAHE